MRSRNEIESFIDDSDGGESGYDGEDEEENDDEVYEIESDDERYLAN